MKPKPWSMPRGFWEPKTGMARSTAGTVPSSAGFALLNLTVQRASRSLWHSLAGLLCHSAGIRPALISAFSAEVLRWRGAATRVASTIWPDIAM